MIKLLIQSDDYGITNAVSMGICEGIQNGLIKNTGMFVNMPTSYQSAKAIKDVDVCLGIDINYVCGRPITDPKLIPHLVNAQGQFYKSGEIFEKMKKISTDEYGLITFFEEDPYPYDEIYLETENQIKRFVELVGRLPEYIHAHSLCTPNTHRAAVDLSRKYGIYHSMDLIYQYPFLPLTFDAIKGQTLKQQLEVKVIEALLKDLSNLEDNQTYYFICHSGYVDFQLFDETTLTLRRIKDLDAMLNKNIISYIKEHNIELITYRDLKGSI